MNTTPTPAKRTIPPSLTRELKAFYKKSARRHLPWRATRDPYKILVSEVMLQQTQVDRVIPYYKNFLKQFPTAGVLAKAPLSQVLKAWQGLGYNRRGKYLWEAGKLLAGAKMSRKNSLARKRSERETGDPRTFLRDIFVQAKLPGVGPYTAAAVRAFAFNEPTVFIETNIRTVFFHHLGSSSFLQKATISDKELLPLVEEALKKSKMEPRDFYAALMDYGSCLKKQGVKLNSKSKHYKKQSKFDGSTRQKSAAKLRELLARGASEAQIKKVLNSK